jgi:glycerol-3-phosphate acyltransferase PlsX
MEEKPSHVMRHGKDTSMWSAIESVRNGEATVAVSCGNTGALMLVSMVRLRKLPGIYRPAIGVLWPSKNPQGFNIMLDGGRRYPRRCQGPDAIRADGCLLCAQRV